MLFLRHAFCHAFCLNRPSLICSFHFTKRCVSILILFIICCCLYLSLSEYSPLNALKAIYGRFRLFFKHVALPTISMVMYIVLFYFSSLLLFNLFLTYTFWFLCCYSSLLLFAFLCFFAVSIKSNNNWKGDSQKKQ